MSRPSVDPKPSRVRRLRRRAAEGTNGMNSSARRVSTVQVVATHTCYTRSNFQQFAILASGLKRNVSRIIQIKDIGSQRLSSAVTLGS